MSIYHVGAESGLSYPGRQLEPSAGGGLGCQLKGVGAEEGSWRPAIDPTDSFSSLYTDVRWRRLLNAPIGSDMGPRQESTQDEITLESDRFQPIDEPWKGTVYFGV